MQPILDFLEVPVVEHTIHLACAVHVAHQAMHLAGRCLCRMRGIVR